MQVPGFAFLSTGPLLTVASCDTDAEDELHKGEFACSALQQLHVEVENMSRGQGRSPEVPLLA